MNKQEFINRFLFEFAFGINNFILKRNNVFPQKGGNLWVLCDRNLIPFIKGQEARKKYDSLDKTNAQIINMDFDTQTRKLYAGESDSSEIDKSGETIVFSDDFSWAYMTTHEYSFLGPFFIENIVSKKNKVALVKDLKFVLDVLKDYPSIKDKVISKSFKGDHYIEVVFNDHLTITGALDGNGVFEVNNDYHLHIEDPYELIRWLIDIADGRLIFIQSKCYLSINFFLGIFYSPWNYRNLTIYQFEKIKPKYLKKRCLKIYSGNGLIKDFKTTIKNSR